MKNKQLWNLIKINISINPSINLEGGKNDAERIIFTCRMNIYSSKLSIISFERYQYSWMFISFLHAPNYVDYLYQIETGSQCRCHKSRSADMIIQGHLPISPVWDKDSLKSFMLNYKYQVCSESTHPFCISWEPVPLFQCNLAINQRGPYW